MKTYIYLDDERVTPANATHRVYTAPEAVRLLMSLKGQLSDATMSFDHDLGDDRLGTGYSVAVWIESKAHNGEWDYVPRTMTVHSANPAGAAKIRQAIASIEKMRAKG